MWQEQWEQLKGYWYNQFIIFLGNLFQIFSCISLSIFKIYLEKIFLTHYSFYVVCFITFLTKAFQLHWTVLFFLQKLLFFPFQSNFTTLLRFFYFFVKIISKKFHFRKLILRWNQLLHLWYSLKGWCAQYAEVDEIIYKTLK